MTHRDMQPVTTGAYYSNGLTATLTMDHEDDESWFGLRMTVPTREGATRGSLGVLLYNEHGVIYAACSDQPWDDVPLGEPIDLSRPFAPVLANNPTWEAGPLTSRISIDTIYWSDENWDTVDQVEAVELWAWYRDPADAPAGSTLV